MPDLALSIVLGIALAAATGFRVFLPMLIVSGVANTGHLQLGSSFAWLGTPSALTMLCVAAFAEVLAYYVPVIDNLLDTLTTPAALVAGTVVSAAVMTDVPPMVKWTAAVVAGGHRRPHARGDRNASSSLHGFDGRSRQRRNRNRGAWRCTPDILSRFGGTGCRYRAGDPVLVTGDTPAPPVFSRSKSIEQRNTKDHWRERSLNVAKNNTFESVLDLRCQSLARTGVVVFPFNPPMIYEQRVANY
jgi:Domain of unknown function (DUF4126)